MDGSRRESDEPEIEEEIPGTTVVHEHSNPDPGSISTGALSSSGIGHPDFDAQPGGSEPGNPLAGAGSEPPLEGTDLGETIKKHAACDVDHVSGPAGLGWMGPTRTGPSAQTEAQRDADEHNRKHAGHSATVMDGEGAPPE